MTISRINRLDTPRLNPRRVPRVAPVARPTNDMPRRGSFYDGFLYSHNKGAGRSANSPAPDTQTPTPYFAIAGGHTALGLGGNVDVMI